MCKANLLSASRSCGVKISANLAFTLEDTISTGAKSELYGGSRTTRRPWARMNASMRAVGIGALSIRRIELICWLWFAACGKAGLVLGS